MFERLIFALARHFLFAGTKFFFGIGEGPSKGEVGAAGNISSIAGFDTNTGETNVTNATNFWNSILSGNQDLINKALGPQFGAIAGRAQQEKATTAAFGNRSGGTNASIQSITDQTRAADTGLVGELQTKAADALMGSGLNLTAQGLSGDIASFEAQDTIHGQHSQQVNDIFKSIMQTVAAVATGGASLALPGGGIYSEKKNNDAASLDATASGGYNPNNTAVSDQAPGGGYGVGSVPGTTGFEPPNYYSIFQ